jgi:hypothetical protein
MTNWGKSYEAFPQFQLCIKQSSSASFRADLPQLLPSPGEMARQGTVKLKR